MPFYNDGEDSWDNYAISTELKFMFLPRRCYFSNKLLWLVYAYRKTAMWTGPGNPIFEYRYYDKDMFLVNRIKGTV